MRNVSTMDGYIARIEEIKTTPNGKEVLEFTVACSNGKNQFENTVFMQCTAWGNTAKLVDQYFGKGDPIGVTGMLKQDDWEDKESGRKRSKILLNVTNIDFPLGKGGGKKEDSADKPQPMSTQDIPF